jgi:hypothetical protein
LRLPLRKRGGKSGPSSSSFNDSGVLRNSAGIEGPMVTVGLGSSFFLTFIGIGPASGSYISPRPGSGFRLIFRSLKERLSSSSEGASASRFKVLSLSTSAAAVGGVCSDEDDANTGIICHSPATPASVTVEVHAVQQFILRLCLHNLAIRLHCSSNKWITKKISILAS